LLSHKQIETAFKDGKIQMAIIFATKLNRDLSRKHKSQVQLITDASDPNTATTTRSYATQSIIDDQKELTQLQILPYQNNTEIRMVYNPELKAAVNFVPGVMSLILLLVCVLMTSVAIVKEKETGTMEILLVSPFNPFLVIVSKAVPY